MRDEALRAFMLKRCLNVKIGLINAPQARRLDKPVYAVIAGSAPTAHLIGELEKINIKPVHVYGLTCVPSSSVHPVVC